MPRQLVAIDPGDEHTGVAFFEEDPDAPNGWVCTDAQEHVPDEFNDAFAEAVVDGDFDIVVIERFRLYADKAELQTGSEFLTSQQIGVLRWIIRNNNAHAMRHHMVEKDGGMLSCEMQGGVCADPERKPKRIKLIMQMADIKKPTRAILNRKKIKSVAAPISKRLYNGRDHCKDAELHGWKAILDGKI